MPRLTKTQAGLATALKKQFGASLTDERAALARPSGSLLPCPFCGGEAKLLIVEYRGGYMVRCNGRCLMANVDTGFHDGAAENAIAAWNKRAKRELASSDGSESAIAEITEAMNDLSTIRSGAAATSGYIRDMARAKEHCRRAIEILRTPNEKEMTDEEMPNEQL